MDLIKTKFFVPLILLYFLALILPSIYSYFFFNFWFLYLNVGSLIVPFIYMYGDIITDLYHYKVFKKVVISSAIVFAVFAAINFILLRIMLHINPDIAIPYQKVLGNNYRIVIAVLFGVAFSSLINGLVLSKLRKLFKGKYFIPRSIFSSFVGELFEAIFVGLIGYLFILPIEDIFIMAMSVMAYRIIITFLLSFPAKYLINMVRKFDGIPVHHHE